MGSLTHKWALVTGAASGIGRATAIALGREGCQVVMADRAPERDIAAAAYDVEAAGGSAFAARVDVADENEVLSLFDTIRSRYGRLDILFNNAGIFIETPLLQTPMSDFDRLMAVNLRGAFMVGREALRMMSEQGSGRVINVASELAYLGRAECSVYCASKGAIVSMTRAWAREFAPKILVNAIAPGPIDTPLLGPDSMSPEMAAAEADIPLERIGRPEEVAGVAVFLAGPAATFMTGQCVSPNGGAVMF